MVEVYPVFKEWGNNLNLQEYDGGFTLSGPTHVIPINLTGKGVLYALGFGTNDPANMYLYVWLDGKIITGINAENGVWNRIAANLLYSYGNSPLFELTKYDTTNKRYMFVLKRALPFNSSFTVEVQNIATSTFYASLYALYGLE